MARRAHWAWLGVAALLAVYVGLTWLGRMPGIWTGSDDVQYLLLSRSLRALQYREMFRVDMPIPAMYPPGYPALLALWALAPTGPDQFDWLLGLSLLCTVGTFLLVFHFLKKEWGPVPALICVLPLVVNQSLVRWGGTIASEAPYMFLSILALWLLWRRPASASAPAGDASPGDASRATIGAVAAIAILAALTRSAGVTLLLGIGAYWLFQRRWRRLALFTAASAVTVGAWQLWTIFAPEKLPHRSYIGDLAATAPVDRQSPVAILLERLWNNVPFYLSEEIYSVFPLPAWPGTPIDNLVGSALLAVGLAAGLVLLFQRWRVAFWYLLAYGALLAVWPYRINRFLVPLLPILIPIFLLGIAAVVGRFAPRLRLPAMAACALVIATTGAMKSERLVDRQRPCERWGSSYPRPGCLHHDQASFFAASSFITQSLPKDAVVLSAKGAVLYYYTGRRVGPRERAFEQSAESFVPFLRDLKIDHVLLGSLFINEIKQLGDHIADNCGAFSVVASFPPRTYLFRLREQPVPKEQSEACRAIADFKEANAGRNLWQEEL